MTFIHFKLVFGAFTNNKKRLLASSCQSVRPQGTTRLPLEGFLWNLVKISHITGPRGPDGSRKLRYPDYVTMAQDGGKVVSLAHRPPLPPGNTPGTHFCYRLSRPQGHSAIGRMSMKNSNDTIGNRTSDL